MNTEIDEMMIDELREGFAPAGYERTMRSFRSPSRAPYVAGVAVIAAVAATVVVVGGDGARSPALAWSPTPTAATAADEAAARKACAAPDGAAPSNGVVSVSGIAVAQSGDTGAGGQVAPPPGDGTEIQVEAGSSGVIDVLPPGEVTPGPQLPTELPPLVSLDLRGTGGLAVFADEQWTFTCMLVSSGDGFETGPIMVSPTESLPPSESLAIVSGSQTIWADGRSLTMVSGAAPAGAAKVELSLPGQPVAETDVVGGRFSIWWFGSFDPRTGTIRALAADGSELATQPPMIG
jgi:hypothetical protein